MSSVTVRRTRSEVYRVLRSMNADIAWMANVFLAGRAPSTHLRMMLIRLERGEEIASMPFMSPREAFLLNGVCVRTEILMNGSEARIEDFRVVG